MLLRHHEGRKRGWMKEKKVMIGREDLKNKQDRSEALSGSNNGCSSMYGEGNMI